jgi:hypothetical protein
MLYTFLISESRLKDQRVDYPALFAFKMTLRVQHMHASKGYYRFSLKKIVSEL